MARHHVLRAIGRAQAAMGQTAQSITTFDKALALARTFEPDTAAITSRDYYLSALAIDQANAGQIEEALRVVKAMDGNMSNVTMGDENIDEERRAALYYIAKAQAWAGKIAEALETARSIRRKSGTLGLSVGVVAEGLAEADRMADALEAVRFEDNPSETLAKIARGRAARHPVSRPRRRMGDVDAARLLRRLRPRRGPHRLANQPRPGARRRVCHRRPAPPAPEPPGYRGQGHSARLRRRGHQPVPRHELQAQGPAEAARAALPHRLPRRWRRTQLELALEATLDPVKLIRIQVNGVQAAEHQPERGLAPGRLTFPVPLAKGRNVIRVVAVNQETWAFTDAAAGRS